MRTRSLRGSYTVEAAFVIPIVLLSLSLVLRLGFGLCRRVQEEAERFEEQMDVQEEADIRLVYLRMTGMLKEVIK